MGQGKKGLVVSDVDGVVLDFYKGAARVLEEMLGRPMVKVDNRPATRYRYGLTREEYQRMRHVMRDHPHGWGNLPTLPGAVEAIRRLRKAGHEVVFLSSCGQSLYGLRRQNLDLIGLKDCRLICVEDAEKHAKGRILERLNPQAFIDDHMTMVSQATFVPELVWIDHGCSLEIDPATGRPFIQSVQAVRTPSLARWVDGFLARPEPRESLRARPVPA